MHRLIRHRPARLRPALELLEVREVPASGIIAVGADAGSASQVRLLNRPDRSVIRTFSPYDPAFTGGVRVALGDFNNDSIPDVVTAPGPGGGPHIKVFNGATFGLLRQFFAYDPAFRGGVYVAVGNVNGDSTPDIVTGAGEGGGPHVKVFDGLTGVAIDSFFAYDVAFRGGVTVAAGDVNSDARADIITGAGPGGGPHVKVINGATGALLRQFMAFDSTLRGGVFVAAADLNANARADIVAGAGPGGSPQVRIFDGSTGSQLTSFSAYDPAFRGGVRVAAYSIDATGQPAVITAPGTGGGQNVRVFAGVGLPPTTLLSQFTPGFTTGAFVSGFGLSQFPGQATGNFFPPTL
jgi:hypothetical protein